MINREYVRGIEFHDCKEKEIYKHQYEFVHVYKKEDNKWYLCIVCSSDYLGDERETQIKICPYCGKILL